MLLLCRSSCSTTCELAPLIRAAKRGLVRNPGPPTTLLFPVAGPCVFASLSIDTTLTWSRPASADPNQSKYNDLVRSTTSGGRSANFNEHAHDVRSWEGLFAPFVASPMLTILTGLVRKTRILRNKEATENTASAYRTDGLASECQKETTGEGFFLSGCTLNVIVGVVLASFSPSREARRWGVRTD